MLQQLQGMATKPFPWDIRDVKPDLLLELKRLFRNDHDNYVQVGPKGYFLPGSYRSVASDIYNLKLRPDDIFVLGFPRSGTTRTRELVWIIGSDWNFAKAKSDLLINRYVMTHGYVLDEIQKKMFTDDMKDKRDLGMSFYGPSVMDHTASPRFILYHLPLSLLSPNLLDSNKAVYVARDPRDVVVSYFHFQRRYKMYNYVGDFKTFWHLFRKSSVYWSPYFEHVKEAWNMRHHQNLLFLFYEDVSKDMPSKIREVAKFLGKPCSEENVLRMCEHLNFDNFKKNEAVNHTKVDLDKYVVEGEESFIRKGKSGAWRDYFDEEMIQEAESWMEHNLRDTDLRFPPT